MHFLRPRLALLVLLAGTWPSFLAAQPAPVAFHFLSYAATGAEALPKPGEFRNPILSGFYPDPSVCQVGSDYYLINSTFAYFPGIPIFHSKDLLSWRQIGNVIHRPAQLRYAGLGVSRGIFAPAISHHDGLFYVVCTMVDAGGNFVVTATDPAGPWSDPSWLRFEGIDPSLFFDDDGRAWIVNNGAPKEKPRYDGHRAIWIQEFDPATREMKGPRTLLVNGGVDISKRPIWIEGPHLYKVNGWYYLSCAEGGTSTQHSQVIFRSRNVEGPYEAWSQNPILTQRDLKADVPGAVTSTGHADFVQAPDRSWWAIFLGVRPYGERFSPMGRETFLLPVRWTDDGWPTILPATERVPLAVRAPVPSTAPEYLAAAAKTARWTEDFDAPSLDLAWLMLRAPQSAWWRVAPEEGKLLIHPRSEAIGGRENPSFLARRVQHAAFSASTQVDIPAQPGVQAGLVVFQSEKHYYFAGVRRRGAQAEVFVQRAAGNDPIEISRTLIPEASSVTFRTSVNQDKCGFEYSTDAREWHALATDQDAKLLTTEVAGGFVGATVGLYAHLAP